VAVIASAIIEKIIFFIFLFFYLSC